MVGKYTGKYSVGQRVNSGRTYPAKYYGTIRKLNINGELRGNNAYGVQWDGEFMPDGTTPQVFWCSEDEIEAQP